MALQHSSLLSLTVKINFRLCKCHQFGYRSLVSEPFGVKWSQKAAQACAPVLAFPPTEEKAEAANFPSRTRPCLSKQREKEGTSRTGTRTPEVCRQRLGLTLAISFGPMICLFCFKVACLCMAAFAKHRHSFTHAQVIHGYVIFMFDAVHFRNPRGLQHGTQSYLSNPPSCKYMQNAYFGAKVETRPSVGDFGAP